MNFLKARPLLITLNILIAQCFCIKALSSPEATLNTFGIDTLTAIESNLPALGNPTLQQEIETVLSELKKEGAHHSRQADSTVRPVYVTLQAMMETQLAVDMGKRIDKAIAIFHTPAPPTPLCLNENVDQLVAGELVSRPDSMGTITYRKQTLTHFLKQQGQIIAVYTHAGLDKRTPEQLSRFHHYKLAYPDNFLEMPVNHDMAADYVGATYLIKHHSQWYLFAIRASQAISPKQTGDQWSLFFGPINQGLPGKEYDKTLVYLNKITEGQLDKALSDLIGQTTEAPFNTL